MPNNNVAILSIMSKFDEKSAREAAKRADKVYEEALSDIGNVNFDKKLIENFDKAMNLLKNKFKKVNLSSYTNSLLDSIFSDKDIKEKSKDIELFINKIEMLKKASSGQDINAFNTFSAKQIDALISRTEKLTQKQEEINEKTREYNREATKIAKANRSISTIDKNYGNQDYSKTLESLKKSLGTEKEFTAEQNQSIENLAKMVNLYQIMEKSEPQKGTAEAIRYSKDLLAVTQKIKEERDKIDVFSQKGASTYIANNGLSSVDKVSDYTVNKSKEDFVKASLSNLKSQEAKLQSELTTYISDSVQKNLAKVSKEVDAVVDKAEKRVENLQNKIESLQTKSTKTDSDNSIIGGIVSEIDIKSLEEIEDRLYAISDLDAEGEATKQQLKEYIQLYKQYERLVANDSTVKFDPGLKEEYDFILESDNKLKKYADTLDKTVSKQNELNDSISNADRSNIASTQTEQFVKQEELSNESINNLKNNLDIAKKDIEGLSLRIKNLEDNSSFSNISEQVFNLSNAIETLDQKLLSVYEKLDKINETNLDWGKIQYHQGNLENIKNTRSRDDFGDMISGLIYGGYLERGYGYGSGGTGLYTAMNTEDFSDFAPKKNGKQSVFGYAIDWSKYPDAFVAETEEVAKDLHVFLSNLEAFCIKLGSGFKGFDEQLGDIDEQKLYNQYQNVFHEVRMDFDEFQNFISEMSSLVKSAGNIKDEQFTSISNELSTSDNISTRFMRANGYSGINVSSVKNFDNADIGSVLYDIRDGAIIKRFETLYDLKEFADRQIQEINKVVTSNNVASIDVQKIINDISEIKNEILELNEAKQNIQDAISSLDQPVVNTTSTALPSNKSNISLGGETFKNDVEQVQLSLQRYKDTIAEIDKMKLEPETEESKKKIEELIQLTMYFKKQALDAIEITKFVDWGYEGGGKAHTFASFGTSTISGNPSENSMRYAGNLENWKLMRQFTREWSDGNRDWYREVKTTFSGINEEINTIINQALRLPAVFSESEEASKKYIKQISIGFQDLSFSFGEGQVNRVDKILERFPELEQMRHLWEKMDEDTAEKFSNINIAKDGMISGNDEWLRFIQTLPKAQEYLKAIGYEFKEVAQINQTAPIKDVFQGDDNSNVSFSSNLDEIEKEKSALLELRNTVSLIIEEIDRKTQAFYNEKSAVDLIIPEEIATLESLERELKIIIESIEQISKIPINIDFNLENLDENSANIISKLKDSLSGFNGSSLTNISSILEGFKISKANVENLQKLANAILTLKSNLNNVGNSGQQFLSDIKELVAQSDGLKDLAIVLKSSKKQIDNAKKTTNANVDSKNTEENANAWKELTYSIQRYSEVSKRISSGKALEGDIEEASRLENKISQLQKLDILSPTQIEKSEQMLTKLYDSLDDIEKKSKEIALESLNSSIDKYRNDYNSRSSKPFVGNQSDEYKKLLVNYETSIKELEAYRDKIRNNPLVSKEDLNQIDELTKKVKKSATAFNSLTSSQKGSTPLSRGKTIEWANDLLEQNSKWSKKAKIEVQGWINKLATADPSNVEEIRNRILEIVRAEREAGNAGKTWLDIFSTKKLHHFLGQAASMFSFYDLVNVGREIVTNIKEVDTALTELRKVSDATEQRLTTNFKNSADTAKELGATISDVISATADWSRMGYNIDQAEELARVSTLYKNVGDGIDIETANNSLISTLQGFQLDVSEAESIIDKFNEVANNYAIDSAGIGEALQRSAASFNAANTDLSKSIALITATNEVVQDPDSVGTLWKTMSARIRGAETELQQLNEETDEYTKTTSKLRDLVQSLTGFDIMIDEDTFKDVYEIIIGIGKEWDNLTDAEQASLGEALAGKRNANALYAVLGNLDTLQSAYETAENSAGSAMREQENYEKSIQYSLDRLSASAQEWSNTLVSSDVIKWFVDLANAAVELSTALTPLGTLALGGGIFAGIKNIGRPKMFGLYKYADINMCSLGY